MRSSREQSELWLREVLAGCISSTTALVLNVSLASVIFHGALEAHLASGIVLVLLCNIPGPVLILMHSKLSGPTVHCADPIVAVCFAEMGASVFRREGLMSPLGTMAVAMGMSTAALGLVFYLLGLLRVGRVVQLVPTPVVAGFVSSMSNFAGSRHNRLENTISSCWYVVSVWRLTTGRERDWGLCLPG